MKINRAILTNGIPQTISDAIDFSSIQFDPTHIKSIPVCNVTAVATDYEQILRVEASIEAKVIGICSYSLEEVEIDLNIKDELIFTDDEEDEDNYYEKGNLIDLDPYILGIILANVPVRIIKKGAKLPQNGKDYRVISEDEYVEEQANKKDPRFDILDSVEFPDDDEN